MSYENLVRVAGSSAVDKHIRDEAFSELVRRFQPMVSQHANRTLGDSHKAKDAAQTTFLEAFTKLHQLKNPLAFPSWLRQIVRTQCHRQIRKQRNNLYPIDQALDIASTDPDPLTITERNETTERLSRAIDKLPEPERVPTRMYYYERLSHAEIADHLGIEPKTVKSRLHSARGRLKITLQRNTTTLDRLARELPVLQVSSAVAPETKVVAMPSKGQAVSMAA